MRRYLKRTRLTAWGTSSLYVSGKQWCEHLQFQLHDATIHSASVRMLFPLQDDWWARWSLESGGHMKILQIILNKFQFQTTWIFDLSQQLLSKCTSPTTQQLRASSTGYRYSWEATQTSNPEPLNQPQTQTFTGVKIIKDEREVQHESLRWIVRQET